MITQVEVQNESQATTGLVNNVFSGNNRLVQAFLNISLAGGRGQIVKFSAKFTK